LKKQAKSLKPKAKGRSQGKNWLQAANCKPEAEAKSGSRSESPLVPLTSIGGNKGRSKSWIPDQAGNDKTTESMTFIDQDEG